MMKAWPSGTEECLAQGHSAVDSMGLGTSLPSCCPFQFRIRQEVGAGGAGWGWVGRGGCSCSGLEAFHHPVWDKGPGWGGPSPSPSTPFRSLRPPAPRPTLPHLGGVGIVTGLSSLLQGNASSSPQVAAGGSGQRVPPPPSKVACHLETKSVWEHLRGIPWVCPSRTERAFTRKRACMAGICVC